MGVGEEEEEEEGGVETASHLIFILSRGANVRQRRPDRQSLWVHLSFFHTRELQPNKSFSLFLMTDQFCYLMRT